MATELAGPWTWINGSAYNKTVPLLQDSTGASGARGVGGLNLARRERPHVLMQGGVPRYLFNGAEYEARTFTMVTRTKRRRA